MDEEVVEALNHLARQAGYIAGAIIPNGMLPGEDETGGKVGSLTEAVMGVTAGLCRIADAISKLADAVESRS